MNKFIKNYELFVIRKNIFNYKFKFIKKILN